MDPRYVAVFCELLGETGLRVGQELGELGDIVFWNSETEMAKWPNATIRGRKDLQDGPAYSG